MTVSISYTLWRNPNDRFDTVNLADLDEAMRRGIEGAFPVPRPAWMVEQLERMRYPLLWEAVRTTWHRDSSEFSVPSRPLVEHANRILSNRFRKELGLGEIGADRFASRLAESAVNPRATVTVDCIELPALEIDTDPFVYAIGVELAPGTAVTAVIPRDDLDYVHIKFARRPTRSFTTVPS